MEAAGAVAAGSADVQAVRRWSALMDAAVLFQVIPSAESLRTDGAGEWSESSVDSLVPGELFVASEGLSAGFFVTFEWSFTY